MDPLEKIAGLLKTYYTPFQMIENKYRNKVTAIGLLKSALFSTPEYLEPYYNRLLSYKGLIRDHTDNMKLAENIAVNIFALNIKILLENYRNAGRQSDAAILNNVITLVYPNQVNIPESQMKAFRNSFVEKYRTDRLIATLATYILRNYLNTSEKYDKLADMVVKCCLTGITQEDVSKRIGTSDYIYFVFGIYSKSESRSIYNITLRTHDDIKQLKYFTKMSSLARAIINQVESNQTTINFFGELWEPYEEIKKLFGRCRNLTMMFY